MVGLYITYYRREDAARAITAVDGSTSPGGGRDVMRASFGTTKYCMAFLRNQNCSNNGCMDLHEWGDEKDCFTKEDLTTLYAVSLSGYFFKMLILGTFNRKHTMKDTENQQSGKSYGGKTEDGMIFYFAVLTPTYDMLRWSSTFRRLGPKKFFCAFEFICE